MYQLNINTLLRSTRVNRIKPIGDFSHMNVTHSNHFKFALIFLILSLGTNLYICESVCVCACAYIEINHYHKLVFINQSLLLFCVFFWLFYFFFAVFVIESTKFYLYLVKSWLKTTQMHLQCIEM